MRRALLLSTSLHLSGAHLLLLTTGCCVDIHLMLTSGFTSLLQRFIEYFWWYFHSLHPNCGGGVIAGGETASLRVGWATARTVACSTGNSVTTSSFDSFQVISSLVFMCCTASASLLNYVPSVKIIFAESTQLLTRWL